MSSSALDSQGMVIQWGSDASPQVWSTIPEVTEISGPGGQANEIDVTDLSSSAKEFRMGLQDEGQISLSMLWLPANTVHNNLRTDRANQTLRTFRITFTDSPQTEWVFTAFVLGIEVSNAVDDVTRATVTLRVSDAIVQT